MLLLSVRKWQKLELTSWNLCNYINKRVHLSVNDAGSSPWRPISSHFQDPTWENTFLNLFFIETPANTNSSLTIGLWRSTDLPEDHQILQKLVWWSSEDLTAPHKTNQKSEIKKMKMSFLSLPVDSSQESLWYLHYLPFARVKSVAESIDALHIYHGNHNL